MRRGLFAPRAPPAASGRASTRVWRGRRPSCVGTPLDLPIRLPRGWAATQLGARAALRRPSRGAARWGAPRLCTTNARQPHVPPVFTPRPPCREPPRTRVRARARARAQTDALRRCAPVRRPPPGGLFAHGTLRPLPTCTQISGALVSRTFPRPSACLVLAAAGRPVSTAHSLSRPWGCALWRSPASLVRGLPRAELWRAGRRRRRRAAR